MRRRRFFFLTGVVLLSAIFAGLVMLLWNAILPAVAHVGRLTYGQAFGLLILGRLLSGRLPFRGWGPPPYARSRWTHMTEEERQRVREQWRKRCEDRRGWRHEK